MCTTRHGLVGRLSVDLHYFVLIAALALPACRSLQCPPPTPDPPATAAKIAFASGGPAPVIAILSLYDSGDLVYDGFAAKKYCINDREGVDMILSYLMEPGILTTIQEGTDGRYFTQNDGASVSFRLNGQLAEFTVEGIPDNIQDFLQLLDEYLRELLGSRYDVPVALEFQDGGPAFSRRAGG